MDRTQELTAAGKAAGLIDPDLLKVAKPDLSATEAMHDLVRRFPGAFRPEQAKQFEASAPPKIKSFYEMTPSEKEVFMRRHRIPVPMESVRNAASRLPPRRV